MPRQSSAATDQEPRYRETTDRFWLFTLVTEVHEDGVYVRLSPFHRSFRRIPTGEVDAASVRSYSPSAYGGWHWGARTSPQGNNVYRLRGSRGVELRLAGGTRVFVGSQTPSAFADAVERVVDET